MNLSFADDGLSIRSARGQSALAWSDFHETFTPRYRGVEVNGDGCGECTVATETIAPP